MEKIKCAAIKYKRLDTGKEDIIRGHNHAVCMEYFYYAFNLDESNRDMEFEVQGFVTTEGRFVDRQEAYQIAKEAKQLKYNLENVDWLDSYNCEFAEE